MPKLSGVLKVGEANASLRTVAARQRGSTVGYYAILIAMMAAGAVIFETLDRIFHVLGNDMGVFLGIAAGGALYTAFARKFTISRFRRRLANRGIPLDLPLSMDVTPDKLCYAIGQVEHKASWDAVTELFEGRGYWIFLVQSSPWYAPKRFFANVSDEREFVGAALERMSDAAKLRSSDAVKFAGGN